MDSFAPIVKARNPRPDETVVGVNDPVSFYVCGGASGEDGVDIAQVTIVVNGISYGLGDQAFVYSGSPDQYLIQVNHPDFEYEQRVDVEINARSLCGEAMAPVSYSFSTEWEATKDRGKEGRIEIYLAADYSFSVLTLQEDWYRQGQERQSLDLELWYGRYQKLPFIEEMEMRLIAGNTNALGKEVLDNSWLSVKVEDGEWEPIGSDTVILFGPMFSHSKKDLSFKLSIPNGAATKKYFVLKAEFKPKSCSLWGKLQWGVAVWADSELIYDIHPDVILYRAYVFDDEMWRKYEDIGVPVGGIWHYHGEDKKW